MSTLLDDICAFCDAQKMSESEFGVMALNDKNLVPDLRGERRTRPRRLWPETEAAVRRAMASYRAPEKAA